MISPWLELPYRVRFDECGADGRLRPSGLLRYAQDVAWIHSERSGFDRTWYAAQGLTWLVRSIQLVLGDRPASGDLVDVSTNVVGYRRVFARRRTRVLRAGAPPSADLTIDWVLLDASGRPASVPAEILAAFSRPTLREIPMRVPLPLQGGEVLIHPLRVRRHELDPMNHVNNAVYIDYVEEVLMRTAAATALGEVGSRYGLEYLLAAEPGENLDANAWRTRSGWAVRIRGREGRELLRATFEPARRQPRGEPSKAS